MVRMVDLSPMEREVDDDDGDGGDGGDGDDNMRRGVAVNAVVFDARRRTPLAAAAGEKFFIVGLVIGIVSTINF